MYICMHQCSDMCSFHTYYHVIFIKVGSMHARACGTVSSKQPLGTRESDRQWASVHVTTRKEKVVCYVLKYPYLIRQGISLCYNMLVYTYMYIYAYTYAMTYKQKQMQQTQHEYIRTYIHTYIHKYMHTYIHIHKWQLSCWASSYFLDQHTPLKKNGDVQRAVWPLTWAQDQI